MPAWGNFLLNNIRFSVTNKELERLTKLYRSSIALSKDYDWLFDDIGENI